MIQVGAIEGDEELTPLGYHLAKLPVDVLIGKVCKKLLFTLRFLDKIFYISMYCGTPRSELRISKTDSSHASSYETRNMTIIFFLFV